MSIAALKAFEADLDAPFNEAEADERDRARQAQQNALALQAMMGAFALANEPE